MDSWYLVSLITQAFVGPLNVESCTRAEQYTAPTIVCRRASVMTNCEIPGKPGYYTACPKFDFPQVTLKP